MDTYYLVDFENVNSDGLKGCNMLGEKTFIDIFFTGNASKIDMNKIADCGKAKLEMHSVPSGKQSLDMILVSYLGYLVGKNITKEILIFIVSKDKDFDNSISFWSKKYTKVKMRRITNIDTSLPKIVKAKGINKTTSNKKTELNQEIMQAIAKVYEGNFANEVAKICSDHYGKPDMLLNVHNDLMQKYDGKADILNVYNIIKPIIKRSEK